MYNPRHDWDWDHLGTDWRLIPLIVYYRVIEINKIAASPCWLQITIDTEIEQPCSEIIIIKPKTPTKEWGATFDYEKQQSIAQFNNKEWRIGGIHPSTTDTLTLALDIHSIPKLRYKK